MSPEATSKPLINLLRGWPNTSLLPTELLKKASSHVLDNPDVAFPGMLYGPDEGHPQLKAAVAGWLTDFYTPTTPIADSRITITGGASQNLGCVLQVFTDPIYTRNIWCVAPCYMLAFRIFQDAGFHQKMRAVPEDEEGIDIGFLKSELQKSEQTARDEGNLKPEVKPPRPWGKIYRHIIYAVPSFSNPSFKTMSLRRREELVRTAREFDALIITDDVYDFLQWPSSPHAQSSTLKHAVLPRIVDIDRALDGGAERSDADGFGNAASNGSFSKIFGPGLRTGWVEGTPKFAWGVSQTGTTRSGGAPSQLTSTFISNTLESGKLQSHIFDTLQPAYAARYRSMVSAVHKYLLPLGMQLPQTDREVVGGYFIWLSLPSGLDASIAAEKAKDEENLIIAPGAIFEVPEDTGHIAFPSDLRLCFAWEDEDKLPDGVERLGRVIQKMQREGKGTSVQTEGLKKEARNFW